MLAGRITVGASDDERTAVSTAAQFWTLTHGVVMLELAGYYGGDGTEWGRSSTDWRAICLSHSVIHRSG
jgi:hypothetical protein